MLYLTVSSFSLIKRCIIWFILISISLYGSSVLPVYISIILHLIFLSFKKVYKLFLCLLYASRILLLIRFLLTAFLMFLLDIPISISTGYRDLSSVLAQITLKQGSVKLFPSAISCCICCRPCKRSAFLKVCIFSKLIFILLFAKLKMISGKGFIQTV